MPGIGEIAHARTRRADEQRTGLLHASPRHGNTAPENTGESTHPASNSETHVSRKRMKPLPSRLGVATQCPQGES